MADARATGCSVGAAAASEGRPMTRLGDHERFEYANCGCGPRVHAIDQLAGLAPFRDTVDG